jgi:hypothetical protein
LNSTGAAHPGVNNSITGSSEITLNPFLVGSKGRESLRMEIAGIGSAITSECEFNLQLQSAKTIRQVSAKDPSAEIRQLAAQLLSASTETSPK